VIDAAFERLYKSVEEKDRKAAWAEIEGRTLDQAYLVKLADIGSLRGYSKRLVGLKPYFYLRLWGVSVAN
jgi:peptide/nickel transport system substrate-binding protein